MLRFDGIKFNGEVGQFRAHEDRLGWRPDSQGSSLVRKSNSVRQAEWFDGQLRLLCEIDPEARETEVLGFSGFRPEDYDSIWRFLQQQSGVFLKKHQARAAFSEADFDAAQQRIEEAADRVDEAQEGSARKKAREADLMKIVEGVRDGLQEAVRGDRASLVRVFAADGCERIGRLRLVIDTVRLEVFQQDPRWLHVRSSCTTIEAVLKELGRFRTWRPSQDGEHSSMQKRMRMVQELRVRSGEAVEEDEQDALGAPVAPARAPFALPPQHGEVAAALEARLSKPPPEEVGEVGESEAIDDGSEAAVMSAVASRMSPSEAGASVEGRGSTGRARMYRDSIFEGWVWKRSRHLRRWRRRWLVLRKDKLMSFKTMGDAEATEMMPTGAIQTVLSAHEALHNSRAFCIHVQKRVHFFICDFESDTQDWMREILQVLPGKVTH
mmetsp:Transcript_101037/g.253361  ORF Transcript_101037/g.253361 Transcript_101037/m.253361 type:complete len:438 (-) Transcript_101037:152-1465(-)